MRKTTLAFSALVSVAFVASAVTRAEAFPLAKPSVLSGAVDELAVVDKVHCRRGSAHHSPTRVRGADGCVRNPGGTAVVPDRTQYTYWGGGPYDRYYRYGDYQTRGILYGD